MLITDIRYFKPQIVTAIFRANDLIAEHEEVVKLGQIQSGKGKDYTGYTFAVQYKDFRTQRHAPDHLYLKISSKGATRTKRELDFYQKIVPVMTRKMDRNLLYFPVCYDSYYDEAAEQCHLILDDFTKEYGPSKDNAPPTARHREQVMDTLAMLHAFWWEHPLLGELAPLPSAGTLDDLTLHYLSKLDEIKQSVGKYLDKKYLGLLETIASGFPQKHKERLLSGTGLTIIHNNLVPENLVYSVRESYIINWHSWTIGLCTDDLAMMIPLNWPDHIRKFQEQQLLKRYYDTLVRRGVKNYTWDNLEYDYRASLARVIGNLLVQWTLDEHTRGHWRIMESAMDSFFAMGGETIYSA